MAIQPLATDQNNVLSCRPSFSLSNRIYRAVWILAWGLLASWTPRPLKPWRRLLLRAFGARMGAGSDVRGSARVWYPPHLEMDDYSVLSPGVNCYNMAPISIGRETLISQGVHLCAGTHDFRDNAFQLTTRPIRIGANVWIAAEAFVGPGAVIGDGVVLGARGVANGPLEPWGVYAGNPARFVKPRVMREQAAR